ncbi:hypothetical protein JCM11641_004762 [Rhodosporidiobolus odoratus]
MTTLIQRSTPSPGVLLLTLDRPPLNTFTAALFTQLKHEFETADNEIEVRVVVLAGAGSKGFTAGLDLREPDLHQSSTDPSRTALLLRSYIAHLQASISSIAKCSKPVIVAVHGLCLGAGVDVAAACDVRLCSSDAVFAIKEVDIGLAADVGSLQRLPKVTSNGSQLTELALTARNFGAQEAEKLGLVSRVVQGGREEVLDAALILAKVIAAKSPIATLSTKHLLNHARDHSVQEGLEYTQAWNMAMLQSADIPTALASFAGKTPPEFAKLPKAKL